MGSIIYFPHNGFRVKLVIEPVLDTMKHVTCNFNYNAITLGYKEVQERIEKAGNNWDNCKKIVNDLFKRE